jgi:hypothetical protein
MSFNKSLHVNSEAREVAQKIYRPLFAQNLGHPIYFDLDNDFAYSEEPNAFEGWVIRYYIKHFDDNDNDPADFRWELRNIIVHSDILGMMNSPLRVMSSLSKLVIQHQHYTLGLRDQVFRELTFLRRVWEEVHGQDVPPPKYRFITGRQIEGIMAVSNIGLHNLPLHQY